MKKILSLLLVILVLISQLPLGVMAEVKQVNQEVASKESSQLPACRIEFYGSLTKDMKVILVILDTTEQFKYSVTYNGIELTYSAEYKAFKAEIPMTVVESLTPIVRMGRPPKTTASQETKTIVVKANDKSNKLVAVEGADVYVYEHDNIPMHIGKESDGNKIMQTGKTLADGSCMQKRSI